MASHNGAAPDGEAQMERRRRAQQAWREANTDRIRENQRQWRERNADRIKEQNRTWRAEHPERKRELNRESARRRAAEDRVRAESRSKARERARTRRDADPAGTVEYQRRWRAANPDKIRAHNQRYAGTHREALRERAMAYRDSDPEAARERVRQWASAHKEYLAEYQRQYRQDPEKYQKALAANRDAKRLRTRLRALDLPARQIHRTPAAERRAHQHDADHFFTSTLVREHYKQYEAFEFALDAHIWHHCTVLRERAQTHVDGRARAGLPPQHVENAMFVHAIWDVVAKGVPCDTLTADDLAHAVTYVKATHARRRQHERFRHIADAVANHTKRNTPQLRQDAEIENRARVLAGKPPVRIDVLAHRIAFTTLAGRLDLEGLTPRDIDKAINLARETHPVLFDTMNTGPVTAAAGHAHVGLT